MSVVSEKDKINLGVVYASFLEELLGMYVHDPRRALLIEDMKSVYSMLKDAEEDVFVSRGAMCAYPCMPSSGDCHCLNLGFRP